MRHMPRYNDWIRATPEERMRLARINVRENPHLVAYWLYIRCELFKKHVLDKKWEVSDYWSRFEWQGRGSGHTHSLIWIRNAPDVEVDGMTDSERDEFAAQWVFLITAVNPDVSSPILKLTKFLTVNNGKSM